MYGTSSNTRSGEGETESRVLLVDTAAITPTGNHAEAEHNALGSAERSNSSASLSALSMYAAECAAQPRAGGQFVHHRDTALNRILHNLRAGRKSQLVVLGCASPAAEATEETVSTLRFTAGIRA